MLTPILTRADTLRLPLWARELLAFASGLSPVEPSCCIVWEDPETPEEPLRITRPTPKWLAMALHGGILPPIEAYAEFQDTGDARSLHEAPPIAAMTEQEAMEYLLRKDLPRHVWEQPGNRPRYRIVRQRTLPTDRCYRNAWRLRP
jgi:hypothetical protein